MGTETGAADGGTHDRTRLTATGQSQLTITHKIITGGPALVSMHGHLGDASAQYAYPYLEDVISRHARPVTVHLSRRSSCDIGGVIVLAHAASLTARGGYPFRLTGRASLLRQIMVITGTGYLMLRWPAASSLEWGDPAAVSGSLTGRSHAGSR